MNQHNQHLETLRHSLSHILAAAVKQLYPDVKLGIGPAIENGFYYDFDFSEENTKKTNREENNEFKITPDHLVEIEKIMHEIISRDLKFERVEMDFDEALDNERADGQIYKVELLEDLKKEGEKKVTYYKLGDFSDLCRGPHLGSTGEISPDSFKLNKLAGAYWRGDEKNKMLTRIYGLAFRNKGELEEYVKMLEEAEKRDHRKLAKELELFIVSEEIGQGLVLYLPKGAFVRRALEDYMYRKEFKYDYSLVMTPILAREEMYKKSGHLAHYREDMYNPIDIEGENYFLKPMNCPHHHIMYRHKKRSYRELPIRYADFGMIHRYERSGVLTGLIRARNFSQNDAHIYCTKKQVKGEIKNTLKLLEEVYRDFEIKDYWFRLSLPDFNDPEKFGDIENKKMWDYSAGLARQVLKDSGAQFVEAEGEAAFYGPKIDIQTRNVLGKEDTIATIQVDFYMPRKFELSYVDEKGKEETPVVIHRAIMGSFERFFAFLIEKTAGAFPVWLSPVQVKIISVGAAHVKYCHKLLKSLKNKDIRAEVDDSNETVGNKIRKAVNEKIPFVIVIGDKEMQSKKLAVRDRGSDKVREVELKDLVREIKASYPKI